MPRWAMVLFVTLGVITVGANLGGSNEGETAQGGGGGGEGKVAEKSQ
jgi:hypothetical protein